MPGEISGPHSSFDIALARRNLRTATQSANSDSTGPVTLLPCSMMGLELQNPVGIAAGLDKTGQIAGSASAIGFGYVEIGSVTPENLNSVLSNLKGRAAWPEREVAGINVSCLPNANGDEAIRQYVSTALSCLAFADYLVLNLTSPFTSQARACGREWYQALLSEVVATRDRFQGRTGQRVPVAIKVSMAKNNEDVAFENLEMAQALGFQGAMAVTPTGMAEDQIHQALSLAKTLIASMTLVSVGGIATAAQVHDRICRGAGAVQLFTAIVEQGPFIARKIISELAAARTPLAQSRGDIP